MTPLYILLTCAAVLLALLVLSIARGRRPRLRAEAFARRALLSPAERHCYQLVVEAVGEGYLVCPRVAALALLQPAVRGRRRRRLVQEHLSEGTADLVICTRADTWPLMVVRLRNGNSDRRHRRGEARLRAASSAAGMPTLELALESPPAVSRIRELIEDAIALGGLRAELRGQSAQTEAPGGLRVESRGQSMQTDEEEATVLARLSAAMRDAEEGMGQR